MPIGGIEATAKANELLTKGSNLENDVFAMVTRAIRPDGFRHLPGGSGAYWHQSEVSRMPPVLQTIAGFECAIIDYYFRCPAQASRTISDIICKWPSVRVYRAIYSCFAICILLTNFHSYWKLKSTFSVRIEGQQSYREWFEHWSHWPAPPTSPHVNTWLKRIRCGPGETVANSI